MSGRDHEYGHSAKPIQVGNLTINFSPAWADELVLHRVSIGFSKLADK